MQERLSKYDHSAQTDWPELPYEVAFCEISFSKSIDIFSEQCISSPKNIIPAKIKLAKLWLRNVGHITRVPERNIMWAKINLRNAGHFWASPKSKFKNSKYNGLTVRGLQIERKVSADIGELHVGRIVDSTPGAWGVKHMCVIYFTKTTTDCYWIFIWFLLNFMHFSFC